MEGIDAAPLTRRALLGTGIGVGAAAALAGCGRDGAAPLRFWAMSYEGDYAPHLLPAFTAATGIPVDTQSLPWTAAHEKLLTANAGDALPDVFMLPAGWIGEFAMIGALAPVTEPAYTRDLVAGALEPVRWNGQVYAVPWSAAPQVQFFRRDLLADVGYDAPPGDWAGWREMGRALKRRRPGEYAFLTLVNWFDTLFTFYGQSGAWVLRERDTRGNFRDPANVAALAFYVSLFREGLAPGVASTEIQDPLAAFAQGYFAIFPNGPTLLLDLKRRAAEIAPELWGAARMPGPHGPAGAAVTSNVLAVSAHTSRSREAWALLRHLTSTACELQFQRLIGVLPARASAYASPQLAEPILTPFAEQIADPAPTPKIVEFERIRLEVQLVAERVVRGELSIDAGAAEMDRRVDALLAKRRALVQAGRIA